MREDISCTQTPWHTPLAWAPDVERDFTIAIKSNLNAKVAKIKWNCCGNANFYKPLPLFMTTSFFSHFAVFANASFEYEPNKMITYLSVTFVARCKNNNSKVRN